MGESTALAVERTNKVSERSGKRQTAVRSPFRIKGAWGKSTALAVERTNEVSERSGKRQMAVRSPIQNRGLGGKAGILPEESEANGEARCAHAGVPHSG